MNYTEALDYIHKISWTGSRPGLERIRELCSLLGDPQDRLRYIHVGGTNGKGSFCSMLSSVLAAAGKKVGIYTSPYVRRFNERIMINGTPISDGDLTEYTEKVKLCADKMEDPPTEFELITALAFLYFAEKECDTVVLEMGLGGRLDATNIIKTPILSVITGIALDHTAILGNTEEEIAGEKAGIIKAGVPVLCGCAEGGAKEVIKARAKELGCEFYTAGRGEIRNLACKIGESSFDYGRYSNVKIRLMGLYQPQNCARVLDAVTLLNRIGENIPDAAIYGGLASAKWPARFELIGRDPDTVFDGGHNPEGIAALINSIKCYYPEGKAVLLSGVMGDKAYTEMVNSLSPLALSVFTFAPNNPRALDPEKYAEAFAAKGIPAKAFSDLGGALREAKADAASKNAPLVICGSLYSYCEVMDTIEGME